MDALSRKMVPHPHPKLHSSQDYPSIKGIASCLLVSGSDMITELLSSGAYVSLTNPGEKNTDSLNEHVCICIEIWTFYAYRVSGFLHLCV